MKTESAAIRNGIALLAITDNLRDGIDGLCARALASQKGGVSMLQVRLKDLEGRELVHVSRQLIETLDIPVLVNDRIDVAMAAGAAGVHLGMSDISVKDARSITPPGFIIGVSFGHESDMSALYDADYVGIGPIHATPSKTDAGPSLGLKKASELVRLAARPCVAIGGIDVSNATEITASGFDGVSVVRAVLSATNPEAAARDLREAVNKGLRTTE